MNGLGPYISLIIVHAMIAGTNFGLAMGFSKVPTYSDMAMPIALFGLVFLLLGVPYYFIKLKSRLDEILAKGE